MRRFGFTAFASIVVFAFVPANALARQHSHHHRGHHHSRVHVKNFGDPTVQTGTVPPTTTPSAETAGTVQSFTGGVLTIALNGGGTVSGSVSNDTELECEAIETSSMHQDGDQGGGGGPGDGDGDGGNDGQQMNPGCSTANLTPGTVVREAELRISSAGSTWERVVLELQNAGSAS